MSNEYIVYINADAGALDAVKLLGAMTGAPCSQRDGTGSGAMIPQGDDLGATPTYEARELAACTRVKIDKQQRWPRVKTPEWIMLMVRGDSGR